MPADDEQPGPSEDRPAENEVDEDATALAELRESAESEVSELQRGSEVSIFGASLPTRVLLALGVFVLAFMIVWMVLWGLLGGIGLVLGWVPAVLVGLLAIRLFTRSVAAHPD